MSKWKSIIVSAFDKINWDSVDLDLIAVFFVKKVVIILIEYFYDFLGQFLIYGCRSRLAHFLEIQDVK